MYKKEKILEIKPEIDYVSKILSCLFACMCIAIGLFIILQPVYSRHFTSEGNYYKNKILAFFLFPAGCITLIANIKAIIICQSRYYLYLDKEVLKIKTVKLADYFFWNTKKLEYSVPYEKISATQLEKIKKSRDYSYSIGLENEEFDEEYFEKLNLKKIIQATTMDLSELPIITVRVEDEELTLKFDEILKQKIALYKKDNEEDDDNEI